MYMRELSNTRLGFDYSKLWQFRALHMVKFSEWLKHYGSMDHLSVFSSVFLVACPGFHGARCSTTCMATGRGGTNYQMAQMSDWPCIQVLTGKIGALFRDRRPLHSDV